MLVGEALIPRSVRNLIIAVLWAARKSALWAIRSNIAPLAAKALAPIDRRRALLMQGTLSQYRHRNRDHARFWADAAVAYPDDCSILRMRIHSALRSGDAGAADAGLTRLIALRGSRADDSRFVVGLTNIDRRNGAVIRLRSRIRRFLGSLRGSPEYRVAAVRLSRSIFAHFPRATKRRHTPFRTQLLHMVGRSQLQSHSKLLLQRVAACEFHLEESCPGSLFDTDISIDEVRAFVGAVRKRIFEQIPFSFVRLGDGEAACLPYEPHLARFGGVDARERERIWWGRPLDPGVRAKLYPRLARAIFDADCIGIPTVSRFLRELRLLRNDALETSLTGRGLRAVLHCAENWNTLRSPGIALPVFVSCHLHQDIELWNCYEELFDGVEDAILVSCHESLGDWLHERFGLRIAGHVLLPPDEVTGSFLVRRSHTSNLPSLLDSALDRLGDLPRNRLVLVGAGLPGKLLVTEARARGGIALDLGSIFDHWLGLRTRSYLDLNSA